MADLSSSRYFLFVSRLFACRSCLSQVDVVGATETDMDGFLRRALVLARMRPHNAPRAASLFSAKITMSSKGLCEARMRGMCPGQERV